MFTHGRTNYTYYSVRVKINYYKKVINGRIQASVKTRRKAKLRLKTLNKINKQSYNEPRLIITDNTHFVILCQNQDYALHMVKIIGVD